jgi:alkanesulfonate monooxygenase SsuD/methylene tetrahydromethanopterin reductase-like flavin-dependent oxidoreductase (luciferase family)
MKYGFVMPFGDARAIANYARDAESAGWDGFFLGEAVWHIDVWISLAAAAMRTERIRLGTMISPLPRMRPWKLASETATLDNLSNGRVILGIGVGVLFYGYQSFLDEVTDLKTRAELMDEGIDQGEPFKFEGKHYHVDLTKMDKQYYPPRPVQQPRIPIWVVGVWPRMKSMRRALRCDGLIPNLKTPDGQFAEVKPDDIRAMRAYIDANRTLTTPFDITCEGNTIGMSQAQMRDRLAPYAEAGATWWLESPFGKTEDEILKRLRQSPPNL